MRLVARLAARRTLAMLLVGLASLVARALLLPILPPPRPAIQDEFSYLLASDTFASGRLANPTPAFADRFETPQELIRPVYASKYPPFSSLVMAAAQKLTGRPWLGVWFSMGLLCAALCWALQGWLPAVWAFAGSLVAVVHIGIVSYWTESYWGGTCAATGGALLVGAMPRLIERPRRAMAVIYGLGSAILANTRPYEGLVFAVVCSGYVAAGWLRNRVDAGELVRKVAIPIVLVLAHVAAGMAYYNFRLTGSPLELPYVAHDRQYALIEPVLWQTHARAAPQYSSAALREFWQADRDEKLKAHRKVLAIHAWDLLIFARFLVGWPLAAILLLVIRPLWRDPIARRTAILAALAYIGPALDTRMWPHYAAPMTVLAYILVACGLRALKNAWPEGAKRPQGAYLLASALLIFGATTAFGLLGPDNQRSLDSGQIHSDAKHARVEEKLEKRPSPQLVLVRYGPKHDPYEELVYNRADIDRSQVIWARSLGPAKDAEMLGRYPDREAWMLTENRGVTLKHYCASTIGP